MSYDLIVIGGGPAGYIAAIRGAQLGKKVVCVERDRVGGTCLNWGCIPTKALLKNAHLYHTMKHKAAEFGMSVTGLTYDWEEVIKRSRSVSARLAGGVEHLFRKNKIEYVRGEGSLLEVGKVVVKETEGGMRVLEAPHIIMATGCKPRELPNLPFDGEKVISSKEAMTLTKQPKKMVIIGAGAIGVEFAYIYNAFGTEVTIVEMMEQILPVEDEEVGASLQRSYEKAGIKCLTSTKMTATEVTASGVSITLDGPKGSLAIEADVCLVAIGVAPVLPGGMELELDRGYIVANERYEASLPGVYAVGDIIGPPWLAHTAMFEAVQCVEGIFVEGHQPRRVERFPGCTYSYPEVASVGKTERALKEEGVDYKVGKFPYMALGKAQASGETEGFVKLLFGKKYGELLGAHIVGENATDLISEMGLALEMEATADDLHATIHAHPTLAEGIHEATLAADGHPLHI